MSSNVKNYLAQPASTEVGEKGDNVLNLGGTVNDSSGSQEAFVADATDQPSLETLLNALRSIAINNGLMSDT